MKKFFALIFCLFVFIFFISNIIEYKSNAESTLRWSYFPIFVYIEPHPKKAIVEKAFIEWTQKSGNIAKFRYVGTDRKHPHITVKFSSSAIRPAEHENAVGLTYSRTSAGLQLHADIIIYTNKAPNEPFSDGDIYRLSLHEIGHALGLKHSSSIEDIMYPTMASTAKNLSEGDIKQFKSCYKFVTK